MSTVEPTPERVEKLMGLTAGEFAHSIAAMQPTAISDDARVARFAIANGEAVVTILPLPHALLGGLVKMPRARVTIEFRDLAVAERAAFLRRFDIAFQRGGG